MENRSGRSYEQLLELGRLKLLLDQPELSGTINAYRQLEAAREGDPAGLESFQGEVCLRRSRNEILQRAREALDSGEDEDHHFLEQLVEFLSKPYLVSVMDTYDAVEQQREEEEAPKALSPLPVLPPANGSGNDGSNERPVKQVGIRRNPNEKLGIVLKLENGEVVISRILVGLGADRQGLLHVGDTIVAVDGVSCTGQLDVAEEQIRKASGSFTIKLVPSPLDAVEHAPLFYRALFDYDPTTDLEHPFPSGGMQFKSGDVLEVVNSEDPNWWQARLAGAENRRTGLIPARGMQERRLAAKRNSLNGGGGQVGCLGMRKSKSKPVMYSSAHNADFDRHDIITYEEVVRAPPGQRRVVALIGAQGVGRRGLKYRLINAAKEKYATTLPTTSRARREDEQDGVQYYFTDAEAMGREVKTPAYLESGEYNGFLYGTKTDSVRDVIADDKVCLLDVNPNALKRLRTAEFKPYVIFIKAPQFETLKIMHRDAAAANNQESANAYTDQDLHRTLQESDHIHKLYQHMFDATIVNDNIEETYAKLIESLTDIESQEQWVPACWMI